MPSSDVKILHHGRRTDGVLYLPDNAENAPAVVLCHGYNGAKHDFDRGARFLAENGVAALSIAFSGGSTRDESGFPTTDMTLFTEREDALAALDFLREHPVVDARRVHLFGGSMGGLVSVLAAQERPEDIAGLGLLFPALGIPDNWNARFPQESDIPETVEFWGMTLGRGFFISLRGLDAYARMGEFTKPVIILQGDADPICSMEGARRAEALYPDAALTVFPGEGHGFTPEADAEVFRLLLRMIQTNARTA